MIVSREEFLSLTHKNVKVSFCIHGITKLMKMHPYLKHMVDCAKKLADIVVFIPIPLSLADYEQFRYNSYEELFSFLDQLDEYTKADFIIKDISLYLTKYIKPESRGSIINVQKSIKDFFTNVIKIQVESENLAFTQPFVIQSDYVKMGDEERRVSHEHSGFICWSKEVALSQCDVFKLFVKSLDHDYFIVVDVADTYLQDRVLDLCCPEHSLNFAKRVYVPMLPNTDGTLNFYHDGKIECDANVMKDIKYSGQLKKYLSGVKAREFSFHSFKDLKFLANVDYKTLQPVDDLREIDSDIVPIVRLPKGGVRRSPWIWNTRPDTSVLEVAGEDIKFVDNVLL